MIHQIVAWCDRGEHFAYSLAGRFRIARARGRCTDNPAVEFLTHFTASFRFPRSQIERLRFGHHSQFPLSQFASEEPDARLLAVFSCLPEDALRHWTPETSRAAVCINLPWPT